ncbi:alpha/beta hydrolase [Herbiconiux sp. L3-i23]|uniref:alpha/beta hydrolase n=1 Tax=Herbiconiux sp. L3-i23 TaxID=2905871 RepID=UPI002073F586|nr:alpha/beta hydrolase [Herbiconiux sp. L3-i23]
MEAVFVHGALVRDGEWWWRPVAELLFERTGIRSRAVELPSCGEGDQADVQAGLIADAEALRSVLDAVDRAVVVGHSYGGTVIAEAGHHPAVAGVLLISSYLPELGETQAGIMSAEPDPVTIADAGGGRLAVAGYDSAGFAARFLHDADPEIQREGWSRVTAQSAAAFVTPTSREGWRASPPPTSSARTTAAPRSSCSASMPRRRRARSSSPPAITPSSPGPTSWSPRSRPCSSDEPVPHGSAVSGTTRHRAPQSC